MKIRKLAFLAVLLVLVTSVDAQRK